MVGVSFVEKFVACCKRTPALTDLGHGRLAVPGSKEASSTHLFHYVSSLSDQLTFQQRRMTIRRRLTRKIALASSILFASKFRLGSSFHLHILRTTTREDHCSRHHHHNRLFSSSGQHSLEYVGKVVAKLSKGQQAWQRFRPMVEMALGFSTAGKDTEKNEEDDCTVSLRSLADIGTDHGLLSFGLATSGKFSSVIGVDVSKRALLDGALAMLEQLKELNIDPPLSTSALSFRHGNGLEALEAGEADIVCVAGMGVNTMVDIFSSLSTENEPRPLLEVLDTQCLVLQPTNTRPRNLIHLYDFLYQQGYRAKEEQLVTLSGRWYITSAFHRRRSVAPETSGDALLPLKEFPFSRCMEAVEQRETHGLLQGYLLHHCTWLRKEEQQAGMLRGREDEWLAKFEICLGDT